MRLLTKLFTCISTKCFSDENLSGSTDSSIGTACIFLGFILIGMFLHKLLKLGFAFFGFQQFFNFFYEYGGKRVEGFFGNVRLKNNFRIANKRHLLNFVASISAGGGQSKIHHNFLLTGGDGCHRPCFIGPWYFLIYQSRISGDVIFILKNSFLTIKNKWRYLDFLLTFTSAR